MLIDLMCLVQPIAVLSFCFVITDEFNLRLVCQRLLSSLPLVWHGLFLKTIGN